MRQIFALITWLSLSSAPVFALCTAPEWILNPVPAVSVVQYKTFFSPTLGSNMSYGVYLPPSYSLDATTRYPVLYWLHGGGSNLTSGDQFVNRLVDALDRGITPPFIVVLANGPHSLWTDSKPGATPFDAPVETVIINELIPLIDSNYRTIATRDGRGIEGFSMGGRGASRLGLKYPELFGLVSNLAGAVHDVTFFQTYDGGEIYRCVYGSDTNYFNQTSPQTHAAQNAALIHSLSPYHFRVVIGDQDTGRKNLENNLAFSDFLTGLGVAHTLVTVPGVKHSYQNLYDVGGDSMFTFFADAWGDVGGGSGGGGGGGDTKAPSTPQGLIASPGGTRVTLTWNQATDNVGVSGYKIFRNGALVATVGNLSYSDTGLKPNISYQYSISAYDAAGNESAKSATVRTTTLRR